MAQTIFSNTMLASCVLAVGLAAACSNDNRTAETTEPEITSADSAATSRRGHEGASMTVTGCLQKGDDHYIITQVNSPAGEPVGTSGSARQGDTVASEQMRSAKHAYSLEGDDDHMEKLVGKQVRIVGMVAETSELRAPGADADGSRGTASDSRQNPSAHHDKDSTGATPAARERIEIEEDDLAKLDVSSVEQIADTCGDKK